MSELITTATAQGRADVGDAVPAAVVDEHRVRAAAGLTMAAGGVAFAYTYFRSCTGRCRPSRRCSPWSSSSG